MEALAIDWHSLFVPSNSILEIVIRGSVIYLSLFFLLRLILKRETGGLGITDVLVVVLIADAAQNGMAGEYRSITEGILLVATILGWSYLLEWLGFRHARVQRLLDPQPLPLIRRGRMLKENMRKELVTEDELMSKLREKGVDDCRQVKAAYMESNGQVSVIRFEEPPARPAPPQH